MQTTAGFKPKEVATNVIDLILFAHAVGADGEGTAAGACHMGNSGGAAHARGRGSAVH